MGRCWWRTPRSSSTPRRGWWWASTSDIVAVPSVQTNSRWKRSDLVARLVTLAPLGATSPLWIVGEGVDQNFYMLGSPGTLGQVLYKICSYKCPGGEVSPWTEPDFFSPCALTGSLSSSSSSSQLQKLFWMQSPLLCREHFKFGWSTVHCIVAVWFYSEIICETAGLEGSCKCGITRRDVFSPQWTGRACHIFHTMDKSYWWMTSSFRHLSILHHHHQHTKLRRL